MCILQSANNKKLACKFIDFVRKPEIHAKFCDDFGFPVTVNVPARQYKLEASWYEIEDLEVRELTEDPDRVLDMYNDA